VRFYLKIAKAKRTGSMAQVVEYLTRKLKALTLNTSITPSPPKIISHFLGLIF
jgi:hypothetical protein